MRTRVYKSESGRELVEGRYREILESARGMAFRRVFVDSTVGRTHVLRFGDEGKPPLVMLHGTMSNSASWLGAVRDFQDAFSVFCVDLPGEPGLTEPVRLPLASEEPSRWLESVLDALGLGAASFLGMSLGSWYALAFAVRHPQRVLALSMVTASGLAPQRPSFLFKALLCMTLGRKGQEKLSSIVYHKVRVAPEVLEYQALVSAHFVPLMEPIPVFLDAELARLRLPIQYFGGDRDALLDSRRSAERLESLTPKAEAHVLPDTGHVILDRFPEIQEFLVRTVPPLPRSGI